jgi:molybdopterin synthase catalytic subunit
MQVKVKLFAVLREHAGASEFIVELPEESNVARAAERIAAQVPSIADFLPRVAVAVNREYRDRNAVLRDGDELALIPPVSGG